MLRVANEGGIMLNLSWEYEVTATNCEINIYVHGVGNWVCEIPHGIYKGFSPSSVDGEQDMDSLAGAMALALEEHPGIPTGTVVPKYSYEYRSSVYLATPRQWAEITTTYTYIRIYWDSPLTTADQNIFGYPAGGSVLFSEEGGIILVEPRTNMGCSFTPNFGADNVDINLNLEIVGSQVHAASNNTADSFYTRVLGESTTGSLLYDLVPAGCVRNYLNSYPGSFFAEQANRRSVDVNNTVEDVLRAASENATFQVIVDGEDYFQCKINNPWDVSVVATAFGGSGIYQTLDFQITKVTS